MLAQLEILTGNGNKRIQGDSQLPRTSAKAKAPAGKNATAAKTPKKLRQLAPVDYRELPDQVNFPADSDVQNEAADEGVV